MATTTTREAGNLPAELTAFVGRRREVAEVRRLLSSSRLVTLTGAGGVGKTRLALRVGAEVRRAFDDGVWLVDLADLGDPALVTRVVATTIGLRDESARWPVAMLSEYLADRHLLLVLDNCEHLLDACAVLADALLRAAPGLRILATSRQALGLPAEHALAVPPLSVPDPDAPVLVEELGQYEAVGLFVDRAAGVLPGFTLTEENATAVAKLCGRLDGLPLAIELAAVRLRALSPAQILERLEERYALLSAGSRAALPRQQSLQALVDWSFGLCSPTERTLWARLSVFSGGFDLEAAEGVCSGDGLPRESMLDTVAGLVDKSVLIRDEHDSRVRYRMLDTIGEYGRKRLAESGEGATLRRRQRDHFQGLAERAAVEWFGPNEPFWHHRLRADLPNVRAALDFCVTEPGEAQAGLRLAATLWYGWRVIGMVGEGRRWLDRLLEAATEATRTRAQALWANACLAIFQGDISSALPMLQESEALGRELGDESVLAYVALFSGQVAMSGGDMARATELLEQALAAHRAAGDTLGTAMTLFRLSLAVSALGDVDRAHDYAQDYLALGRAHGSDWSVALARWALSVVTWHRGDVQAAKALAAESIAGNWSHDDRIGAGRGMEVLAWTAAADGHAERAARLLGVVENIGRMVGGKSFGYPHLAVYTDECKALARRSLGDKTFQASFDDGARLTFDESVAYALDQRIKTAAATAPEPPAQLTRREHEVAELVAQGLSNKEIANSLVISQRTAEGHVEHILTKLGFTSRAQIAAWVAGRGKT